jgi:hypothetical protein
MEGAENRMKKWKNGRVPFWVKLQTLPAALVRPIFWPPVAYMLHLQHYVATTLHLQHHQCLINHLVKQFG